MKNVRGGSDVDNDSDDDKFGLAIGKIHEGNAAGVQPMAIVADVTIADVPLQMEVDTSAFVTIMSQKQYTRLFVQHLFRGHGRHRIEVAGEFTAHVAHNDQEAELPIVVAGRAAALGSQLAGGHAPRLEESASESYSDTPSRSRAGGQPGALEGALPGCFR